MVALATGHDAAVQMIDTSVVRVHQQGACIADNNHQDIGRSRGGLTSKIHALVDTNGLSVHLPLTPGEARDNRLCSVFSAPCFHKRCYSRIVDTTRTGSGSLPSSKEHGRTFRRNEIAKTRSASARICIVRGTWSNGSSTRSINVGASRPGTTNSQPTIWRSSSSHQSEFGYALMSPRPKANPSNRCAQPQPAPGRSTTYACRHQAFSPQNNGLSRNNQAHINDKSSSRQGSFGGLPGILSTS
jgi:hypothetical protein